MKCLVITLIGALSLLPCKTQDKQKTYAGFWEWTGNDDTSTFNLELNELNTSVTGTHCISALKGRKSDCAGIIDEDEISINGTIASGVLKVTFKGNFSDDFYTPGINIIYLVN